MAKFSFDATKVEPWQGVPTKAEIATMSPEEKTDAAVAFAKHMFLREIDEQEWVDDLWVACQLATYDKFFHEEVMKWIKANAADADLPIELKALLFDVMVMRPPSGHAQPVRRRQHARMRLIAEVLVRDFGYCLTRNESAAVDDESAASILERLHLTGRDGKTPMAETSIYKIIRKPVQR